jgi:hypothetical protein
MDYGYEMIRVAEGVGIKCVTFGPLAGAGLGDDDPGKSVYLSDVRW